MICNLVTNYISRPKIIGTPNLPILRFRNCSKYKTTLLPDGTYQRLTILDYGIYLIYGKEITRSKILALVGYVLVYLE